MLNYRRFGSGPALVFLHGFVGSAGYWLPQEVAFKGSFDVISIDLPGFAQSADVPAPDTLAGYGDAVIALLDEIGVGSFSLVGFSMGGMIAQQMALDHGKRIDALVLYGTASVGNMPSRFESWAESSKRIRDDGVPSTTDRTVATWFVDGTDSPMHALTREVCQGASLEGCATVMNAMMEWSAAGRLGDIGMPTLVVCGDRDRSATPADAMVMWEGIPDARLSVLPGCAHGAHLEKPDMFNQVLLDFLDAQRA
jgi:pimeloyl-ACP methyl ester carboxylesterase